MSNHLPINEPVSPLTNVIPSSDTNLTFPLQATDESTEHDCMFPLQRNGIWKNLTLDDFIINA